jgi:hypothetical protein
MTTDKQIAANRRNAARSTGPKTEAGKAIIARNAVSHGLLSRRTLLVGESKAELTALGKALRARLAPVGEVEALLADQIIASAWRLRHPLEAEAALMDKAGCPDLAFRSYEGHAIERSLFRAMHELEALQMRRDARGCAGMRGRDPRRAIGFVSIFRALARGRLK